MSHASLERTDMKKQPAQSKELLVTLRIVVVEPVVGVKYGVQQGKGTAYKVILSQVSTNRDAIFEIQIPAKENDLGLPNFTGPLAQGPPAGRFVYLNIGKYAGQSNSQWDRRLKVPLTGIAWPSVEQAVAEKKVLQARLPGKAKDGGPSCATVQPIGGWQLMVSANADEYQPFLKQT